MVLGMSIFTFTIVHTVISLIAIAAGFVVMAGLLGSKRLPGWTALFLSTTALTSITGFMFPIGGFTPALGTGVVASLILVVALLAIYAKHLNGSWRWIYAVTAVASLYLNVFVLIVQVFQKIPFVARLAPTQSEPPFLIAQAAALIVFIVLGIVAAFKFRPGLSIRT